MNFNEMMARAGSVHLERDKSRVKSDSGKRYAASAFPAYGGSPLYTDSYLVAWIYSFFRQFSYAEARIIDRVTGKHIVF